MNLLGVSQRMQRIFKLIEKIAPTESSVLITGESGTGKELVARAIHYQSRRAGRPFLAVNCGALPEALLESEMFGHVRGAFTGAIGDRIGLFQQADGGTLFLDEVGEIEPSGQVKLLRALQEGEIRRVGSNASIRVNVRILSASNRDLRADMKTGRFREDLFYRLNVFQIDMPPLRERREDIAILARYFLDRYAREAGRSLDGFSAEAQFHLLHYDYPGNVRELENAIQRAVAVAEGVRVEVGDLPPTLRAGSMPLLEPAAGASPIPEGLTLAEMESLYIRRTVDRMGGNLTRAAKALGISRSTLWRKLGGRSKSRPAGMG